MRFAKGHGTENDFVILPDPGGTLEVTPELVARICDRRAGLGGDGVLRAVPASGPGGRWFMDYRNADGSIAETCGNGIRVFARYLLESGLAAGPDLTVETRAGIRQVRSEPDGRLTVDMGMPELLGTGTARVGDRDCAGLRVCVGNPHLACLVDGPVEEFDLSSPPALDPGQFPDGGNVELIAVTGPASVTMRVRERGSGETRSCGTGAVAAAAAAAHASGSNGPGSNGPGSNGPGSNGPGSNGPGSGSPGSGSPGSGSPGGGSPGGEGSGGDLTGRWQVSVPGGLLSVTFDGKTSWLTGPAVIVAEGEISARWLG